MFRIHLSLLRYSIEASFLRAAKTGALREGQLRLLLRREGIGRWGQGVRRRRRENWSLMSIFLSRSNCLRILKFWSLSIHEHHQCMLNCYYMYVYIIIYAFSFSNLCMLNTKRECSMLNGTTERCLRFYLNMYAECMAFYNFPPIIIIIIYIYT